MNADQYRRLVESRRRPRALRLNDVSPGAAVRAGHVVRSPVAAIVHRAAGQLRRRLAAEAAWARLVRPEWLAGARVAGVEHDVIVVEVADSALQYELRRQQPALERELARLVPGAGRLRLVVAGER